MKKILLSISVLAFVGAVVAGATGAFFSDTETSTGNTFTAGAIDLKIDNTSYYNSSTSPSTSWELKDLTIEKFFNFSDVKPGDDGEDTISLHVNNNDSWLCADVALTSNDDNGITEPEGEDGDVTDGAGNGELANHIEFMWWADDGDNVFESDETTLPGTGGTLGALAINATTSVALADASINIWEGTGPFTATSSARYLGKAWCFGDITPAAITQDGFGNVISPITDNDGVPGIDERDGGFLCSGAPSANNVTQTDSMTANISFYAVQSRNNAGFLCSAPRNGSSSSSSSVQSSSSSSSQQSSSSSSSVGALLTAYVKPTQCNVTVDDTGGNPALDTIQEGVDAATSGQTVCVAEGTYGEDVNVNKPLRLSGDGASATSIINGVGTGEAGALVISANDVIVEGFVVNGSGVSAIRISGARDNVIVRHNRAVAAVGKNAFLTDGGQSNHTIFNNVFEGSSSQLAYVNGLASVSIASTNVDFTQNTFGGTGNMALGQEAGASSITLNKFSTVTSFTDVEDWEGGNNYNQNNFNDAGLNLQHSENGNTGDNGITNAENNWWGDIDPSDGDVNANVDVDFTPSEVSAFPEN